VSLVQAAAGSSCLHNS